MTSFFGGFKLWFFFFSNLVRILHIFPLYIAKYKVKGPLKMFCSCDLMLELILIQSSNRSYAYHVPSTDPYTGIQWLKIFFPHGFTSSQSLDPSLKGELIQWHSASLDIIVFPVNFTCLSHLEVPINRWMDRVAEMFYIYI